MPATITLTRPRPGVALITLAGELDLATVEQLYDVLARARPCPEVVLAAAGVDFVDCCALRPLVAAARAAAAAGGRLRLSDPSPALVRLISWCHLEGELPTVAAPTGRQRRRPAGRQAPLAAAAARR